MPIEITHFWDTYDNNSMGEGVWHTVDTIHAFDSDTGNRQKHEPWNSSMSSYDDRDGRSAFDYVQNWITWGTDSSYYLTFNCDDEGD